GPGRADRRDLGIGGPTRCCPGVPAAVRPGGRRRQRHRHDHGHPRPAVGGTGPHAPDDQEHPAAGPGLGGRARRPGRRAHGYLRQRLPDRPGRSRGRGRKIRHPRHRHHHPLGPHRAAEQPPLIRHGPGPDPARHPRPAVHPGPAAGAGLGGPQGRLAARACPVRPAARARHAQPGGAQFGRPGPGRGRPSGAGRDRPADHPPAYLAERPRGRRRLARGLRRGPRQSPPRFLMRHSASSAARSAPWLLAGLALILFWPASTLAQATLPALTATPGPNGSETWSLSVQTLVMLTMLSFLPAALLMMAGFTRIIIVLGLLRNALGTGVSPPNSVLVGLALFLTFFSMS